MGACLSICSKPIPAATGLPCSGPSPCGNYNRIMLSPVLAGGKTYGQIVTHDAEWYTANNVRTRFGETVMRIDRRAKTITTNGEEAPYDRLVIASGSAPFIILIAGKDLSGAMAFRDLDDAEKMVAVAEKPNAKAVVIGGGVSAAARTRKARHHHSLQGVDQGDPW